jgi:serine/threonine protein kinase
MPDTTSSHDGIWDGRYQIERFLGEGERKQVYLATDLVIPRQVALSLIQAEPEVADEEMTVTEWERDVMAELGDHPNVVTMYDVGEFGGDAYMVSQYMGGGDLRELIRRASGDGRHVPLARAVRIATEICDALAHSHKMGFVHRDVQPGNIWLDSDGKAHLGDFDLAISTTDRRSPPSSGQIVTTRGYMPPEEAREEPLDERADLYSFGATLYELCVNRPPFEGTEAEVVEQHLGADPKPPLQLRPEMPEGLDRLILRLLAKSAEGRPPDAVAVRDSLASIQKSLGDSEIDLAELIAAGESHSLEFKSSLRFDYTRKEENRALEGVVAKTVAGLMNAEGGTLLIGVDDDGGVIGIEQDFTTLENSPNLDGWQRALTEALIKDLGHDAAAACGSPSFERQDAGTVAVIQCPARSTPTWYRIGTEDEKFFCRVGNSTRPIPAPFAERFIAEHWPR